MLSTSANPSLKKDTRIHSIDALRGIIIMIMLIDHLRDYWAMRGFSPTDLSQTTAALFLTRWITHFCAPTFAFLAGASAYLYFVKKNKTKKELSVYLLKRGLILIILELTIMNASMFAYFYNISVFLVLWMLGASMIVLAGLVLLPRKAIFALSVIAIAGHNLLDGVHVQTPGILQNLWIILHDSGFFMLIPETHGVLVLYALIPWPAIMALGYVFGEVFLYDPEKRRKIMLRIGLSIVAAFLAIRFINVYGDPAPWTPQKNLLFTIFSFVNCEKYPPSLLFTLMTLGPSIILLSLLDGVENRLTSIFNTFGKVPLFFFIIHFPMSSYPAAFISAIQNNTSLKEIALAENFLSLDLQYLYLIWIVYLLLLYPLCKWYHGYKKRSSSRLIKYI